MKLNLAGNVDCIWCGRRLVRRGLAVDCSDAFGPRPRSEEHIIPRDLFGKLTTDDLCKCCNELFGAICDHALAKDHRIVEAARRAGVTERELWSEYVAVRPTASGRKIRTVYKKDKTGRGGSYLIQPELKDLQRLAVGTVEGEVNEEHLKHLRARLFEKVRRKGSSLPDKQLLTEVDKLLDQVRQAPGAKHYNPVIDESFAPRPLPAKGAVTWKIKPWETDWCMAKITYELSQLLWPMNYRVYSSPVLHELRTFLEKRECSEDGKQGIGKFAYDELSTEPPTRRHLIEGVVTATQVSWSLTFFGTARWSYSRKLTPFRPPPDPGYRFTIINPFNVPADDASLVKAPFS
jgi:hypothetical protein